MLLAGGLVGATSGAYVFSLLRELGQLDLFISLLYVVLLGSSAAMMLVESVRAIRRTRDGAAPTLKKPASTTGSTACR